MPLKKTPDQQRALALLAGPARNVLLFGGSRSGKTFILIYALLVRALREPGSRHAVLRLRFNAVRQSIWLDTLPKVVQLAFPRLRLEADRGDGRVILPNRSEIWFGGLDTAERVDKILGREFATLYFNECSEISYPAVTTALTRLAQRTALVNRAWFDCNPAGTSHWSYKLFVAKRDPESEQPLPNPDNYAGFLMNPAGNRVNLPPGYLEETLATLPERQRRRFLEGRFLDDREGALWQRSWLDRTRVAAAPASLCRVVIGLDPAVSSAPGADETGIVAAARAPDGHFYVLGDRSLHGTPAAWAAAVVAAAREFRADRVVGECNNGGELIESVLRGLAPELPYRAVRAAHGKITRAEPAAALYERQLVHHVGRFPELEDQLCNYQPGVADSPDRLDALVWALTELVERGAPGRFYLA